MLWRALANQTLSSRSLLLDVIQPVCHGAQLTIVVELKDEGKMKFSIRTYNLGLGLGLVSWVLGFGFGFGFLGLVCQCLFSDFTPDKPKQNFTWYISALCNLYCLHLIFFPFHQFNIFIQKKSCLPQHRMLNIFLVFKSKQILLKRMFYQINGACSSQQ